MCDKKECVVCKKDITYTSLRRRAHINNSVCSDKCLRRHYYLMSKEKEVKENEMALCPICSSLYVKVRSDKMTCGSNCSAKFWYRKQGGRRAIQDKKNKNLNSLLTEIENFWKNMKEKRWWAEMSDIFMAIDLYDKIYPDRAIPESVDTIFQRIIDWYIKTKT